MMIKQNCIKKFDNRREAPPRRLVVMAASAGGIDALSNVLKSLPADLRAAILVVQHLRDDRETLLAEHLNRLCPLNIQMAEHGLLISEGVVYLARPGSHLRVKQGRLLLDRTPKINYVRPSADVLFGSAADEWGDRVIGVILSGTGKDGTMGFEKIQQKGGFTLVQDPALAKYAGMPQSAMEAGRVNMVLPIHEIGPRIEALIYSSFEEKGGLPCEK